MKKVSTLVAFSLFLLSIQANAALVTLQPSAASVNLNGSFTVDVIVSDLAPGEELALFDLDMVFDNTVFDLTNVAFGSSLGGPLDSDQDAGTFGPNNAFEQSFLDVVDLQALQVAAFQILTLSFDAIGVSPGSVLTLDILPFGFLDFDGIELVTDVVPATVVVVQPPVNVSEPATLAAMLVGLFGMYATKKRFQIK